MGCVRESVNPKPYCYGGRHPQVCENYPGYHLLGQHLVGRSYSRRIWLDVRKPAKERLADSLMDTYTISYRCEIDKQFTFTRLLFDASTVQITQLTADMCLSSWPHRISKRSLNIGVYQDP